MPATGAIARTAVNVRSVRAPGWRRRIRRRCRVLSSGHRSGFAILPAALAAVLMVTSSRMISGSTVLTILRSTRADAL